jgi:hypothetical protein
MWPRNWAGGILISAFWRTEENPDLSLQVLNPTAPKSLTATDLVIHATTKPTTRIITRPRRWGRKAMAFTKNVFKGSVTEFIKASIETSFVTQVSLKMLLATFAF